jgi:hypothetical protein
LHDIRIEGLEDDTVISAFGSLFRRFNGSKWFINIKFYPAQEKYSLSISQAPILARKRTLNPTESYKQAGYQITFKITDTNSWKICRVSDCPILTEAQRNMTAQEFCFYFINSEGNHVYLPQFELARALFFHDAYLARAAMNPETLRLEFDIVKDEMGDGIKINILTTATYPLISFDNIAARNILSWILVDPNARKSFESIGKYQNLNATESKGYRHWHFQFDPPLLDNAVITARGQFDKDTETFFVYEISSVNNLSHNLPEQVHFFSPKFKEYVRGKGSAVYAVAGNLPEEFTLNDGEDASADSRPIMLHVPEVEFGFNNPFKTRRVYEKKQFGPAGRKDEDSGIQRNEAVSSEESSVSGETPQADWDMDKESSENFELYASKFDCFMKILDILQHNHGCIIISRQIRTLPKLARCNLHLLKSEDTPRCMAVVEIQYENIKTYLLEVDTSDAAKPLSTLLVTVKDPKMWVYQLEELEKLLIKRSLRWPSTYLKKIVINKQFCRIPHPKSESSNKGLLDPDSIVKWAARIAGWLSKRNY